jgi:hypothetical protein
LSHPSDEQEISPVFIVAAIQAAANDALEDGRG